MNLSFVYDILEYDISLICSQPGMPSWKASWFYTVIKAVY